MTATASVVSFLEHPTLAFELGCWGKFTLVDRAGSDWAPRGKKARAVIAYVAAHAPLRVGRERLMALLWADRGEQQARASLRQCLYELRHLSHGPAPMILVARDEVGIDLFRIRTFDARLDAVIETGDLAGLAALLGGCDGSIFEDLNEISPGFDDWLATERTRRRIDLVERVVGALQAALPAVNVSAARDVIDKLEAIDPLDESVARLGMRIDAQARDIAALERRYKRHAFVLRTELGVQPSAETQKLHAGLLERVQLGMPGDAATLGPGPEAVERIGDQPQPLRSRTRTPLALASAVAAAILAGGSSITTGQATPAIPTVTIAAASGLADPALSESLARHIALDFGKLAGARVGTLQIAQAGGAAGLAAADYRVEVRYARDSRQNAVEVELISAGEKQSLWSTEFAVPLAATGDLRPQVAIKLADVLLCAIEAERTAPTRLDMTTLKLFLGACDTLHDGVNARQISLFRQVTERAPDFALGWANLAVAEVLSVNEHEPDKKRHLAAARKHLSRARALDPGLSANAIVEAQLIREPTAWGQRLRLYEKGIERDPDFGLLHDFQAQELMAVGRYREAVKSARMAVSLDPLSPDHRSSLLSALAYSGWLEVALRELAAAERLWPGSSVIRDARFRMDLRYGDAGRALRYMAEQPVSLAEGKAHPDEAMQAFANARAQPTPANIDAAIELLMECFARDPKGIHGLLQALGHFNRIDQAYRVLERPDTVRSLAFGTEILFRPQMKPFRADRRFIGLAARVGLLRYWRSSGTWPDFCRDRGLAYDCQAEAAKYPDPQSQA